MERKAMADIEEFKELLTRLKENVEKGRELYLRNETAVRMQLINPVLTFLGWDLLNPLQVVPEDNIEGGKADYCLMLERQSKRGLFIEAKNLSKNPDVGLRGLMNYCTDAGVLYGVSSCKSWLHRSFRE
jgi:predicted type IV restriction endonuclease